MSALRFFETPESGTFGVEFLPCTRPYGTWKDEVYAAARAIAQRAERPLLLFFSGGLDSEIMCRAFFDQGISFSALTMEHSKGANQHDVEHARKWCWERSITHAIEPFDTKAFFGHDIDASANTGFTSNNAMRYFQLALLKYAEAAGFFAVMGDGGQLYRGNRDTNTVYMRFGQGEYELIRWCEDTKTGHEPFFFRSTPELWAAYLHTPIVAQTVGDAQLFLNEHGKYSFKRFVYQGLWPDASARHHYPPFGTFRNARTQKEAELKTRFANTFASFDVSINDVARALASPSTSIST